MFVDTTLFLNKYFAVLIPKLMWVQLTLKEIAELEPGNQFMYIILPFIEY